MLERHDVDPNAGETKWRSPLVIAIEWGNEEVVRLLLQRDDILVNKKDAHGKTALFHAVQRCRIPLLRLLLDHPDIDATLQDMKGQTVFSIACGLSNFQHGVELFLERPDVRRSTLNLQDTDGSAPLHTAARHGMTDIVRVLLEQEELDVNIQDEKGYIRVLQQ